MKELREKPTDETGQSLSMSSWHANLLWIDRRKCVLFTNDQTLYSLFVPAMKKPQFETFQEVFRLNLYKSLMSEALSERQIESVFNEHRQIRIARTNSRSVLGSMNDLAAQVQCRVNMMDGLDNTDLHELNRELNRIPMGALKYRLSIEEFKRRLSELNT
jgi:hypothetical protein